MVTPPSCIFSEFLQHTIDTTYDTMIYYICEVMYVSKWDKLLARICTLDKGMRFEELRKVLESYGYTMKRPSGGSSHCTFRKEGRNPITIPLHEPIKTVYVQMVKEVIETGENYEYN